MQELADDIKYVYETIKRELGETFTVEQLLKEIEYSRGKALKIEHMAFPPGTTGCALALEDVDLILLRPHLNKWQQLNTILHEGGHFLLRHIPRVTPELKGVTYRQFLDLGNLQGALFSDRANAYEKPYEYAAERLGRLLATHITSPKREVPTATQDLYG